MITETTKHQAAQVLFRELGRQMTEATSVTAKQLSEIRSTLELIAQLLGSND